MIPPFSPLNPLIEALERLLETHYDHAVVYADEDTVLYEGQVTVRANGWIELRGGRLLSPNAVHHIDVLSADTADRN